MILLSFFIPLYASICSWVLPFFINKRASLLYITYLYIVSFTINLYFLKNCIHDSTIWIFDLGVWLDVHMVNIKWAFIFDSLSLFMLLMIGYISGLVHLFSINYMAIDYSIVRFFSLLSLFTFFMYLLVCSSNFVILFLGWEGVGICSYLLISFWSTKLQAPKAGLKAIILNRIGDFGFLGGIGFIFFYFRTFDFDTIFPLVPYYTYLLSLKVFGLTFTIIDVICLLLLLGTVGKSAQIGLHFWLPDAMEGPTPVSALIHAATLVTAGVFLVIRSSFIFEYSNLSILCMLLLGGTTALLGATISFTQSDIKKVIAFSTTSQLGYMIFCCGLSKYSVSIFHLFNHAFFKSLLFLSAGAIIHVFHHEQDIRRYGGLIFALPFVSLHMAVGFLTLLSFPFLSGFYSKDMILETSISLYLVNGSFVYWFGFVTAFLTAFYSFRVFYLVYLGYGSMSFKFVFQYIKEVPYFIGLCLFCLGFAAISVGYIFKDIIIGVGTCYWNSSNYTLINHFYSYDYEVINVFFKNLPVFITILSLLLAVTLNNVVYQKCIRLFDNTQMALTIYPLKFIRYIGFIYTIYVYLNLKWFFDLLFNYFVALFILRNSYNILYKLIDKGVIETICVDHLSSCINAFSNCFLKRQVGYFFNTLSLLLFSTFIFCEVIYFFS